MRWILLSLLLFNFTYSFAQTSALERIGVDQGLSQGFVTCILQDQEGFLWLGTLNGLNRFDGHRFLTFTHDPFDTLSISGNAITAIHEVGEYLLVGTLGHGLNIFHKKTQRFFRVPYLRAAQSPAPSAKVITGRRYPAENVINNILKDADGNIWMKASNAIHDYQGWAVRMQIPEDFWENLPTNPELLSQLKFDAWWMDQWELYPFWPNKIVAHGNELYSFQLSGLLSFNFDKNQWMPAQQYSEVPGVVSNIVWSAAGLGSLVQSPDFQTYHCPKPGHCVPLGKLNGQVVAWDEKLVWVREGPHLVAYRFGLSPFVLHSQQERQLPLEDKRTVTCFDRSGNLWYAEGTDGVVKCSPNNGWFQHYFKGQSIMSKPFMSQRGGVYYLHAPDILNFEGASDAALQAILSLWKNEHLLSFNMSNDGKGHYWQAAYRYDNKESYLVKLNAQTGTYSLIRVPKVSGVPFCMTFDDKGKLWFPVGGTLVSYDPNLPGEPEDAARWRFYDYEVSTKTSQPVIHLEKTPDGSWWMATYSGLIRARPDESGASFRFLVYKTDPNNRHTLHSANVSSLLADPYDPQLLWVGTKGGGLGCLNISTGQVNTLNTPNGLPDNVIYGILSDHNIVPAGQHFSLWLSTNRGIVRYTPATARIRSFRKADGLQDDEFNTHAFAYSDNYRRSGKLMFGGVNGLNVFDPNKLTDNLHKPRVFITGLKVNNKLVSLRDSASLLSESIEYTTQITLPYDQNSISFEFAALEFTASTKNRYRYWIEGFEHANAHESDQPDASYIGLPPGNYTFIVYGSNNDGVWSEHPARLSIRILPPWWRSRVAYVLYALLLGSSAYWAFRIRTHRISLQNELYLKEKEAQTLQAVDDMKTRFFTNVTHELRTPLTLITSPLRQLLQQEQDPHNQQLLLFATKNSQRLLRLVNEILDLSKLDAAKLTLEKDHVQVVLFARRILAEFDSLAAHKNIDLGLETSLPDGFTSVFDQKKVETILYNLIANALKFTPRGGSVRLHLYATDTGLTFELADTGRGILPEDLPHVFDRFYQSKTQTAAEGGTGIGLALSQELASLMGGSIRAHSKPGQGSTFLLILPCERGHADAPIQKPERVPIMPASTTSPNRELPRLLVVEDNEDLQRYLSFLLQDDYQLTLANNGKAALEYLDACEASGRPALIVSDVMMPEMDGFQLLQHLKSTTEYQHIPVVMLTARTGQDDKLTALRIGVDDYLTKPFQEEELRVRIQNLIQRSELRTQFQAIALETDQQMEVDSSDASPPPTNALPDTEWLAALEHYILQHLTDSTFSVASAAEAFGMSRFKFTRALSLAVGMTALDYIQEIQLNEGRRILENQPDLPVKEVAAAVGFTNPKLFSRKFQQRFGRYPSQR